MIYDIFAFLVILIGSYTGCSMIIMALKFSRDRFLFVNLFILALANFWMATVYALAQTGVIPAAPLTSLTLGLYVRPAIIFLLLIPYAIIRRVRLL